jgi:hypothetical protein
MIETFKIRNFKSILDAEIDFRYGEGAAPRHYQDWEDWPFLQTETGTGNRFVPVLAMYGANASGKTNLVNAVLQFQKLLSSGIGGRYFGNKLCPKYDYASFETVVAAKGKRFRYLVAYDGETMREERLEALLPDGGKTLFSIGPDGKAFDGVTGGNYDASRMENALRVECSNDKGVWEKPFLPCLARSFPGLTGFAPLLVDEFLERLKVSKHNDFLISHAIDLLAQGDSAEARQAAMDKITKLLKKFDFGVRGMTMERQRFAKNKELFTRGAWELVRPSSIVWDEGNAWIADEVKLLHEDTAGNIKTLDFVTEESDGTKVVAALLGVCLWALETGRTLFVDELDRSLHPFILLSLIKLFKSKRYNRTNAQLVFTVHDPTPLDGDLLRVSEVGIVDKKPASGTEFRRLCEYKGTRNVFNFRKQYLSGVYSGVPFPYI